LRNKATDAQASCTAKERETISGRSRLVARCAGTVKSNKRGHGLPILIARRGGSSHRNVARVRIPIMADSASPRASRWCAIDRGSLAAVSIAHIASDRRFVAPLDGNPAVRPRQRTILNGEMAPPSPGWRRIGRFEQMVADSHQLSPMRSRILGVLLGSPVVCGLSDQLPPARRNDVRTWRGRRPLDAQSLGAQICPAIG
jgi:hypothetical protein